jgi:hypothetical protein
MEDVELGGTHRVDKFLEHVYGQVVARRVVHEAAEWDAREVDDDGLWDLPVCVRVGK